MSASQPRSHIVQDFIYHLKQYDMINMEDYYHIACEALNTTVEFQFLQTSL